MSTVSRVSRNALFAKPALFGMIGFLHHHHRHGADVMRQQPQQQPQQEQPIIPLLGLTSRQLDRVFEIAKGLEVEKRSTMLERLGAIFRIAGRRGQVSDVELEAALESALIGLQQPRSAPIGLGPCWALSTMGGRIPHQRAALLEIRRSDGTSGRSAGAGLIAYRRPAPGLPACVSGAGLSE